MKHTNALAVLLIAALSFPAFSQNAEEAENACREAADLIVAADYDAALEEARWCVESLQQLKQTRVLSVFPDVVNGFQGGELSNQSALGITVLERTYQSGEHSVTASLTGGVAGGGLAALAQLGLGLSQSSAGKKIRVQRRTVIDMSNSSSDKSEYLVQLKSGGMLTMNSLSLNANELLDFVREFPIAELDDALEN